MAKSQNLESELLRVFRLALAGERGDVGELLLQALELMCDPAGGVVRDAYGDIARSNRKQGDEAIYRPGEVKKLIM